MLFSVLALVTVLRHEMWRDEVHPWQAAIAAESLLEFAESVSAEGHPGLWFARSLPGFPGHNEPAGDANRSPVDRHRRGGGCPVPVPVPVALAGCGVRLFPSL